MSSFLRIPGVLAAVFLRLSLRHFEADSLEAECRDSASKPPAFSVLMLYLLDLVSPHEAFCMTAGSGVGNAWREGPRVAGAAVVGERGGEGGKEGLGYGWEESVDPEPTDLKVLESQDSLTNSVSLSHDSGKGAAASRWST